MKQIELGFITKPQGLKGEFRVKANMKSIKHFNNLKSIFIGTNSYTVLKVVDRGGFFVLKVKGIEDINEVEKLRNATIDTLIDEKQIIDEIDYLHFELICENKTIGKVIESNNFGATIVLTLDNNEMLPIVDELIEREDIKNKILYLNKAKLNEVM